MLSQEKQKKLAYVARRYYLEDQRQSDIAKELGVSRPLISRMLSEARELGVVEITIHEPGARMENLLERLRSFCAIQTVFWWKTEWTRMKQIAHSLKGRWSCSRRSARDGLA